MKPAEIAELLTLMAAAWPKFEPDDAKVMLWSELFADVDFQVAKIALKKLMLLNTFPPSVAELRQAIVEVITPGNSRLPAPEAWGHVIAAIKKYGYYREGEALSSMPAETAKVVSWMGWQDICQSDNIDVVRGQFLRMYETQLQREKERALLPLALKEIIAEIGQNLLPRGDSDDQA